MRDKPRGEGPPSTLTGVLRARACEYGDKLAFRYLPGAGQGPIEISYAELDRQARQIAAALQAACGTGERALLVYPPGTDYVPAFFGCLYAGNLPVPVIPPRPFRRSSRIAGILRDAEPVIVLSVSSLEAEACEKFAQNPELLALPWLVTDELSHASDPEWSDPRVAASSVAFLQYTSGSTAEPKGVVVTHANVLHNSSRIQQAFEVTADDHGVCWLPAYHDMGLIGGILQTIYAGASTTLLSPMTVMRRPLQWLEAISKTRARISGGPDFAYDLCCRKIGPKARAQLDLSCWGVASAGAEPIHAATMDRFVETFGPCGFRRQSFFPCYGLAEATLMVSGGGVTEPPVTLACKAAPLADHRVVEAEPEERDARVIVGCGRAVAGQRIRIVDPRSHHECGPSRVGEIWVSGPSVAAGYYNAPEASKATFHARLADSGEQRFLRTGDLGFLKDGELFVTGRLKDLIIVRGANHYPQDIERSVQNCHARLRPNGGAAFSVEMDGREQLVVVHEVERHRSDLDADEIITAVRQAVAADHELEPHRVVFVRPGGIPRTSSGKIRRRACRDQLLAGSLETVACWSLPFSTDQESALEDGPRHRPASRRQDGPLTAREIRRLLIERLSVRLNLPEHALDKDRPFTDFGMNSLQAVVLADELETWFGDAVSPTLFFNYPSISALAAHLARLETGSSRQQRKPLEFELNDSGLAEEVSTLSDEEVASLITQEFEKLH